ncbi:MAG: hypothetical protein KAH20_12165 [Methylococcales bacterium]|nr:hypothetical protein [Methylococcales bacterium]
MNIMLIILVVEIAVVCLIVVALLLYFRWKKKNAILAEFVILLDTVNNKENERKAYLVQHLVDGYAVKNEEAVESGEYMIEAEKQFLQQFMKQQIEGASVTDFYQNLCELLDQYLYFVPTDNTTKNEAIIDPSVVEQSINNERESVEESSSEKVETTKAAEENLTDDEEQNNDSDDQEEKPDKDDAFAESENEVDDATKADLGSDNKEQVIDQEETEGEPDWGDAFAESGDEVDEATKAGFDADN